MDTIGPLALLYFAASRLYFAIRTFFNRTPARLRKELDLLPAEEDATPQQRERRKSITLALDRAESGRSHERWQMAYKAEGVVLFTVLLAWMFNFEWFKAALLAYLAIGVMSELGAIHRGLRLVWETLIVLDVRDRARLQLDDPVLERSFASTLILTEDELQAAGTRWF